VARVLDAAYIGHLDLRLFCFPTLLFQTLHVFFVISLANREILHVEVTRHPTAGWVAQQIVECCAWDRAPPRFLIHDRDNRYGANFDRRVRACLRIRQGTPFRSPRANAVAERWVKLKSLRSECLESLFHQTVSLPVSRLFDIPVGTQNAEDTRCSRSTTTNRCHADDSQLRLRSRRQQKRRW